MEFGCLALYARWFRLFVRSFLIRFVGYADLDGDDSDEGRSAESEQDREALMESAEDALDAAERLIKVRFFWWGGDFPVR